MGNNSVKCETFRSELGRHICSELSRYIWKQETFFAYSQETFVKNTIKLLKKTQTDITILDLALVLGDSRLIKEYLDKYKTMYGRDELVDYFEDGRQNHFRLAIGPKMFLEKIIAI